MSRPKSLMEYVPDLAAGVLAPDEQPALAAAIVDVARLMAEQERLRVALAESTRRKADLEAQLQKLQERN